MRLMILAALLCLTACTTVPSQQQQADAAEFQRTIPICSSDDDCERQWAAARRWVLDHSDFRLDIYTDDFMETHNSGDFASTGTWARVTKEPVDDARYAIIIDIGCNNPFGCGGGSLMSRRLSFNGYVNSFATTEQAASK